VAVGTLSGYPDGTFQPSATINRAELMKVLVSGQGIEPEAGDYTSDCFPDVEAGQWYEPYVCYAYDQGWVGGYPDGTFLPAQTVNRAEASKMVTNGMAWGDEEGEMRFINMISDVSESDWYAAYATNLKSGGVIDSGAFYPSDGMTREDAASWIFKVLVAHHSDIDYYNADTRQAFLDSEGQGDLSDTAYTDSGSEADIYVTLQSYGDLTITNLGDSQDLSGWTLEDTFGDFVYTFSGTWDYGDSVDVETNGLLDTMPGLYLYDESGNWENSWTTY